MATDDDYSDEEYDDVNDYKEHQERYESLKKEWEEDSGDWDAGRRRGHLENMRTANDEELRGREEAREQWAEYGEDNEGHDQRIDDLRGRNLLLNNNTAHEDGKYEYDTRRMQDMDSDLREELERENDARWANYYGQQEEAQEDADEGENSDMDIESDSDDDN